MTSSDNMDETTKNFWIAVAEVEAQAKANPPVLREWRAYYDPETKIIHKHGSVDAGTPSEEPYILLTRDDILKINDFGISKVIDGKLVKEIPAIQPPGLKFEKVKNAEEAKWKTDQSNMLIIGKDNGWDDKNNS